MDQIVAHNAVFMPFAKRYSAELEAQSSSKLAMLARPSERNLRFSRAASALAHAGQRVAVAIRRVGQPADTLTFTGPAPVVPDDVRARYRAGFFGAPEGPRSLRDSSRNW